MGKARNFILVDSLFCPVETSNNELSPLLLIAFACFFVRNQCGADLQ